MPIDHISILRSLNMLTEKDRWENGIAYTEHELDEKLGANHSITPMKISPEGYTYLGDYDGPCFCNVCKLK